MGLLALGLMVVIVPSLISANGGHNAVVQKISGIEQFVPPREGCVGWVTLDASKSCKWCYEMFRQVLGALHKTYHSTESFYSPAALVASHNPPLSYRRDMKGTCFINYLITDNYKGLGQIFNPTALKKIRTKNWVVFIEGEKTSHFLKCWANTIDANFGFVFPKVVLIMMHTMKIENDGYAPSDIPGTGLETIKYKTSPAVFGAAVACYMCPEGKSYFVGIQQGDKNPYNLLKKAGDRRGNLGPPGISLEASYFNSGRQTPPKVIDADFFPDMILSAVQIHLNFTYVYGDPKSGLIAETVWSVENNVAEVKSSKSGPVMKRLFLSEEATSLVYCRAQYTNKYVTALVSPFEIDLWVPFLASIISTCLLARVRFWRGFDFFWLMQGQPPQAKKVAFLIILASIIMFPLQILYKEYYASNAMTPYKLESLDTNQKVFTSEFRFLCDDMAFCVKYGKHILSFHNVDVDQNAVGKYFIGSEELGTAEINDPSILAIGRDKAAYPKKRRFKDLVLMELESYLLGTKCHMAEENWWVETAILEYTGPLSEAMQDTIQMLRQAGIINFWHRVPISLERKRRMLKMGQSSKFDEDEVEYYESGIVYMNSTLMSLVVIFLGFSGLSILCLMIELMLGKVVALWKRLRERRRYLRAVWPLGKI